MEEVNKYLFNKTWRKWRKCRDMKDIKKSMESCPYGKVYMMKAPKTVTERNSGNIKYAGAKRELIQRKVR